MLFQSQFYVLVFLPATASVYYAVAGSTRARQWVLIGASLVFYSWWDVHFVVLPVSQIVMTWLLARIHERSSSRAPLIAGVALNLLSLGTFKYFNFVLESIGAVVGLTLPPANIILPIGISFFTFQLISYLVDRMRGQAPIYQFRPFALFVLLRSAPYCRPDRSSQRTGAAILVRSAPRKYVAADRHWASNFHSWLRQEGVARRQPRNPRRSAVRRRAFARAQHWRGLDRRARILVSTFPRFLRVHRDGYRLSVDLWLSATGKFPPSLSGDRHSRFLAALAHFAFKFSARLSLYSARWQPARTEALCACDYGHHGAVRLVARRGLDVRVWGLWHGLGLTTCHAGSDWGARCRS